MIRAVWDLKSQFDPQQKGEVFDCMIAEFLLSDGRFVQGEKAALEQNGVTTLEELAQKQQEKFHELPQLESLFHKIEMPLVPILWQMEKNGIVLDITRLKIVGEEIRTAIEKTAEKIKEEVGYEINLNSPLQIGNFLAEKIGVPLSKTKTGRYATNENEIAKFADQFPVIQDLLTHRELSKLASTYVESLITKVDQEGRVHTSYNQVAVSTGRLSSSHPNMQNIPVTSEFGQKIKSCFMAPEGKTLISFDYSQQELRILAHLTGEEKLIQAFKEGRDVHKTTASLLFNTAYEKVTKDQRMIAKTINFGIIYGMSSYGMSQGLTIPVEEAASFIDTFYVTYPKIRTYYDNYIKQGQIDGYVQTLLGRRRYVFEYPKQKFIDASMKRVLMNYPIQGTAADLMKMAMIKIDKEILSTNNDIKMLLQIHDDLVFEVPDPSASSGQASSATTELIEKIREIMCNVYPLVVPVEVDAEIGKRWGEMEKYAA